MTCWRRIKRCVNAGVFDDLHRLLLAQLNTANEIDWSRAVIAAATSTRKNGVPDLEFAPIPSPHVSRVEDHARDVDEAGVIESGQHRLVRPGPTPRPKADRLAVWLPPAHRRVRAKEISLRHVRHPSMRSFRARRLAPPRASILKGDRLAEEVAPVRYFSRFRETQWVVADPTRIVADHFPGMPQGYANGTQQLWGAADAVRLLRRSPPGRYRSAEQFCKQRDRPEGGGLLTLRSSDGQPGCGPLGL